MNYQKQVWIESNIKRCLEQNCSIQQIVDRLGISLETVKEVVAKLDPLVLEIEQCFGGIK